MKSEIKELSERLKKSNKIANDTISPMLGVCASSPVIQFKQGICQWAVYDKSFFPCSITKTNLPSGHYVIQEQDGKICFYLTQTNVDDLIDLPDSASESVIQEINKFWSLEPVFRQHGILWKRGILLWGPPGSGKTSTIQMLSIKIIQNGGIVISLTNPHLAVLGLRCLREIEPKRPVIGILEDIDALIRNFGDSELLSLLDGEHKVDNIVYLATTNYPERLDQRFVNRPGRFDVVKKIGMPDKKARQLYLQRNHKFTESEIKKWVNDTEGFSIAHLKEFIIAVCIFGMKYDDVLLKIKTLIETIPTSQELLKMGFEA